MNINLILADMILALHMLFVLCVILPVPIILFGALRKKPWKFIYNRYFRIGHLLAIGFVVVNTWLGETCPLTILEDQLRLKAGVEGYGGKTFISYWVGELLYYENIPLSVFAIIYTAFTALIISLFFIAPVKWKAER